MELRTKIQGMTIETQLKRRRARRLRSVRVKKRWKRPTPGGACDKCSVMGSQIQYTQLCDSCMANYYVLNTYYVLHFTYSNVLTLHTIPYTQTGLNKARYSYTQLCASCMCHYYVLNTYYVLYFTYIDVLTLHTIRCTQTGLNKARYSYTQLYRAIQG